MGMSNLVPEVRVNKNGIPVTKHVNPAASSRVRTSIPSPVSTVAMPNVAVISEGLKARLATIEFSGFTERRKIMVLKKLTGLKQETLAYLEPTFVNNHFDRVQIESALIELLDRNIAPVKVDDVIHVLRDFEDPGYFEMWDTGWRSHTPWGKYLVNTIENRVLKNLDSMDINGLEYRYESEDREPLRLQQGTDAERAKAVIGLLVNARGMNTELTELNAHFSPGSKTLKARSVAFERMLEHVNDYDHEALFKMLMSEYFKDAVPYLKDEKNMGSVVRLMMASRDDIWSIDYEAFNALSEHLLDGPDIRSEENVDQMYIELQNDLFQGRLVALAETYPDQIEAVVSYIKERGSVIPDAHSGSLIVYLGHEVTPLRNGAL